jgi:hypothetical protein
MENKTTYFMKQHVGLMYYIRTLSNEELFSSVICVMILVNSDE